MENGKRKVGLVLSASASSKPGKLKKVSAFATDEESTNIGYARNCNVDKELTTGIIDTSTANNTSGSVPVVLSDEQRQIIIKTANWVFNNPNQAATLVEKSADNPALSFLNDRKSTEGLFYTKELQRLKAEREVQNICSGLDLPGAVPTATTIATASSPSPTPHLASVAAQVAQAATATATGTSARRSEKRNRWGPPVTGAMASSNAQQLSSSATTTAAAAPTPATRCTAPPPSSVQPVMDERMTLLIQEQKELQMLESRIREAAQQNSMSSSSSSSGGGVRTLVLSDISNSSNRSNKDVATIARTSTVSVSDRDAQLYEERLKHYEELAALYEQDKNFKDTIEDAEASHGVIEGGTYEHRRRAKEMLKTAADNMRLTSSAGAAITSSSSSRSRHMSDYLPKDVLDSFLQQAEMVKKGNTNTAGATAAVATVDVHKIGQDNIGYHMLKSSGWSEGSGLGVEGRTGIVNPITVQQAPSYSSSTGTDSANSSRSSISGGGATSAAAAAVPSNTVVGAGIGVQATHQLTADDDQFDQYRKRMMLAYRFRPNPLNNPRRDYY